MSRHARIEELEDSDPEEFDISTLDDNAVDLPIASSIFTPGRHIVPPAASSSTPRFAGNSAPKPRAPAPAAPPADSDGTQQQYLPSTDQSFKDYQCLYPVYFDAARSRADGRRVAARSAVAHPLAREIADACGSLGLRAVFEPGKTHPQDWANPGRVRVLLKRGGAAVHPVLKNSARPPPPAPPCAR